MHLTILVERKEDGCWLAEAPEVPGVQAQGQNRAEAVERARALALRLLDGKPGHGEGVPQMSKVAVRKAA